MALMSFSLNSLVNMQYLTLIDSIRYNKYDTLMAPGTNPENFMIHLTCMHGQGPLTQLTISPVLVATAGKLRLGSRVLFTLPARLAD
jgi:hypothetical protein